MLLPVNDICVWLRESAATLRAGGADASAIVYDEIAEMLVGEHEEARVVYAACLLDIQRDAAFAIGIEPVKLLDKLGLVIVPKKWVE